MVPEQDDDHRLLGLAVVVEKLRQVLVGVVDGAEIVVEDVPLGVGVVPAGDVIVPPPGHVGVVGAVALVGQVIGEQGLAGAPVLLPHADEFGE